MTRSWMSRTSSTRSFSCRVRSSWRVARSTLAASAARRPRVWIVSRSSSAISKRLAAGVGEDDPEPAPAGGDRAAGQRRDPGEARVAGRQLAQQLAGDDAVLGERPQRDRALVERALDLADQRLVDPVRADRADGARRRVVEEDPGALHPRQPAERLADVVVELAGLGRRVELGDQAGEDLDGRRMRGGGFTLDGRPLHARGERLRRDRGDPPERGEWSALTSRLG